MCGCSGHLKDREHAGCTVVQYVVAPKERQAKSIHLALEMQNIFNLRMGVPGGMGMGEVGMPPMSLAGIGGMWGSATSEGFARGCEMGCGPCESSMGSCYGRGSFCRGEVGGGCGMEAANLVMHIMDDMPPFVTQDPRSCMMQCMVPACRILSFLVAQGTQVLLLT